MTMKTTGRALGVAILLVSLAVPVMAAGERGNERDGAGDAVRVVARVLELDEGQIGAWRDILHAKGEAILPLAETARGLRQLQHEILASDAPDATQLGEVILEIRAIGRQIGELEAQAANDFQLLLTEDQLNRLGGVSRAAALCPAVGAFRALHLLSRPDGQGGGDGGGDRG